MDRSEQNLPDVQMILVPQGAEYQAVYKGLRHLNHALPQVVSIPAGGNAAWAALNIWQQNCRNTRQALSSVLVMGLCGSLKPACSIGTPVLYRNCLDATGFNANFNREPIHSLLHTELHTELHTDPELNNWISSRLPNSIKPVMAVTTDRMIHTVAAKQELAKTCEADVVDMEGFAVLKTLQQYGVKVAMLRVVSDDCSHDVPDLSAAIDQTGTLQPVPLAMGMMRQPIASMRLIRGSLRALRTLHATVSLLFAV